MKIIVLKSILVFSITSVTYATEIELGSSKEYLEEVLGPPTAKTRTKDYKGSFLNLYYQPTNTNYIIDLSKDEVCEIGTGNNPSTCYPCSGENGQDICI